MQEIEENRLDRMSRRRQQRFHQTQNFYKSLQLLQAGKLLREGADGSAEGGGGVAEDGTPFEDYSIFLYRQQAPIFNDRVKELERKLLFPVSNQDRLDRFLKKKLPGCTLRLRFVYIVCCQLVLIHS